MDIEKRSHLIKIITERLELTALRQDADLFMLRKAQVAVLLRWRGHSGRVRLQNAPYKLTY